MKTKVRYNNRTLAFTEGSSITLQTAGCLMKSDIEISVDSDTEGSVLCGGTATPIPAGHKVIIACAGKKLLEDIPIELSEIAKVYTLGGKWYFNEVLTGIDDYYTIQISFTCGKLQCTGMLFDQGSLKYLTKTGTVQVYSSEWGWDSAEDRLVDFGEEQTVPKELYDRVTSNAKSATEVRLTAPTLSLDGNILTVTDESGLAEEFDILVDGEVMTTLSAENDNAVSNQFRIVNKLDGSTLSRLGDGYVDYYYEFENGTPDSVTLNGVTSTTSVTAEVSKNQYVTIYIEAYVSGRVLICPDGGGGSATAGELNCDISFTCGSQTDSDNFVAYTDNGHICFVAGTLIKTPTGYKAVEQFAEGDAVSSYNFLTNSVEEDEVLYFHLENGATSIRYVTFENGTRAGITATHALMTDSGWKCCEPNENTSNIGKLAVGDRVQTANNGYTKVVSIEADTTPQPIYHLALTNNSCLIVTDAEDNEPVLAEHFNMSDLGISLLYA